jgi:hypothetical protein
LAQIDESREHHNTSLIKKKKIVQKKGKVDKDKIYL